jgi:hypothetical protein
MSKRKVADLYEICRSTIENKLENKFRKPGYPSVFTENKETAFASHTVSLLDFRFTVSISGQSTSNCLALYNGDMIFS